MTRRQWIIAGGMVLSLTLLVAVFLRMDWVAFWNALQRTDALFLAFAVGSTFATVTVRAVRWQQISGAPWTDFGHYWRTFNIGQLGNFIYPLRGGDILRLVAISRYTGLPFAKSVTSGVMDRLADAFVVGMFLCAVLANHKSEQISLTSVVLILTVVVVSTALVGWFVLQGHRWHSVVRWLAGKLPGKLGQLLPPTFEHALAVASTVKSPSRFAKIVALSFTGATLDYLTIWFVIQAIGFNLGLLEAVTVGVILHAGVSLPSAPGYVGVYQVASIIGLGLFGVSVADAVAFSVLHQLLGFASFLVSGGCSALYYRAPQFKANRDKSNVA
jgi:glycosyltransferase 2 family protein